MGHILGSIVYASIGFVYLWIRYRNSEKVAEVKQEYYEDRYAVAGMKLLLSIIGIIFMVALLIALFGIIYIILTRPPSAP
ncbi:hypothetical protein [uncultured Kordia sp.]|uniref:hypothetical protein n=1 Tax=uncultured Kordia sp. TaxID=507699 RepID=UPI0026380176|nr:hypothetical protein [uncultured Kordia sp.]